MNHARKVYQKLPGRLFVPALIMGLALGSCTALEPSRSEVPRHLVSSGAASDSMSTAFELQAAVMDMADDYAAELSEAVYLLVRHDGITPRGRWLAQSFMRNGVGAAFDIASGPNPSVDMLDMMVLSKLQAWSFQAHWRDLITGDQPLGDGDPFVESLDRAESLLQTAQRQVWERAEPFLTTEQIAEVDALVDGWIAENGDRTVVSLIRFQQFTEARHATTGDRRERARGLLREVSEAAAVVDDTRLLGERLLWFASRYPYVLGQQTELTAYRLIDQPEFSSTFETIDAIGTKLETLDDDLRALQQDTFERIDEVRADTIEQASAEATQFVDRALEDLETRVTRERLATVDHFFDRFGEQRGAFLDDLESRDAELRPMMTEIRGTLDAAGDLAGDLNGTIDAVDRLVKRFERDPNSTEEPLDMADVRDAAIETGRTADKLTALLERTDGILVSQQLEDKIRRLELSTAGAIDRAFWRGVILVVLFVSLLVAGQAALRFIPRKTAC